MLTLAETALRRPRHSVSRQQCSVLAPRLLSGARLACGQKGVRELLILGQVVDECAVARIAAGRSASTEE